jgi:hypothetical protein
VISEGKEDEGEVASGVGKSPPQAGDGEGLAGGSPDEDIDVALRERPRAEAIQISIVGYVGVAVPKHRRREVFDLRKADRGPAQGLPSCARGLDA